MTTTSMPQEESEARARLFALASKAAGGTVLENAVTGEMKINYPRPATNADSLLAIATVVRHGKTQAVCRCEIFIVKDGQRNL